MSTIEQFLESVSILDTETTGLDAANAEIVEMASATRANGTWQIQSHLFRAEDGIPPEASAKNQISNRMVAQEPTFSRGIDRVLSMLGTSNLFVAHNAAYDQQVLTSSLVRAHEFDLAQLFATRSLWICTWRLSRRIYQHSFTDQLYGQNYLRYKLDLPIPDSSGVHRAGAEVWVCGALLERLIEDASTQGMLDTNGHIGSQLVEMSWAPIPVLTWPIGKHRGVALKEVPTDYYLWALENLASLNESNPSYDVDLSESVRIELESRLV